MHHFESLKAEIAAHYEDPALVPNFFGVPADVLSQQTAENLADQIQTHFDGELNILVNNALYDGMRPLGSLDDEFVQKMLFANIQHPVMLMDVIYRRSYLKPNSRIINVSSIASRFLPFPGFYLLGTCKAALEAITRCWATMLANDETAAGTTVNSLAVGATATEALLKEGTEIARANARKVIASGVPILGAGGMGRPEDVADVAGLLVSDQGRWITGSVVSASGGDFPTL
ncbi:Dehydrogenase OXI1 [Paramyrothecium foliicola]|nr:Dehydrogenase OXI1 [Paramyrothecium foliicola]